MSIVNRYAATAWERRLSSDVPVPAPAEALQARSLAAALRQEGVPVQAYRLVDGTGTTALLFPFLTVVNQQWIMATPCANKGIEITSDHKSGTVDALPSDPLLVAEPPIGAAFTLQEHGAHDALPGSHRIAIFYTPTNGDASLADQQLLDELEELIIHAKGEGRDVVFIDSLGLVPTETVRMLGGDRMGFLSAVSRLRSELARMKSGPPARDPQHPVWDRAYRVIHKHGVDAILENLQFDFWMKSVSFDQAKLAQQALAHFIAHQLEPAAKLMGAYLTEFHRINCSIRNDRLAQQIETIAAHRTAPVLVLLIREIGHFGVLERLLAARGFEVRSKILGADRFTSLLKICGMDSVLENIGVCLSPDEKRLRAIRECLKHLVIQRVTTGKPASEWIRQLPEFHVDRLGWEAIDDLLGQLHSPSRMYLRSHPHNLAIGDQLLYLLKSEHIVPEAWVPDPAEGIHIGGEKHDKKADE